MAQVKVHLNAPYNEDYQAVLRIGPLHVKWSPTSRFTAIVTAIVSVLIYVALFVWYANTSIAYVYPNGSGNWWAGLLHGYFALPSFVMSWFNPDITIYQSPNNGFWYNLWFLLGTGVFVSSARSSD